MFNDSKKQVEEIQEIVEVKSMLRTSIKKYGNQLKQEGIKEGIQKGIQEGSQRKAVETARALLNKKMSVKEIAEITGLSVEEITKL
jgi:predicted transposase/invertase (TIGR01784 family)